MNSVESILARIANEVFDMSSDNVKTRLRTLYAGALAAAAPDELDNAVSDIVGYESDNMLSTMLALDRYDAPTAECTLSDHSAAALSFARRRAERGKVSVLAGLMKKSFMDFVDDNEREIEAIGGFKTVSETLLDLNYASGVSDNLSIRMRNLIY